jgi:hypothetical protein
VYASRTSLLESERSELERLLTEGTIKG